MTSHLAGLTDNDVYFGFVVWTNRSILNLSHHQHPINNSAKHDVFPIQEVTFRCRDKKLATVGVFPTVGHR